MLSLIASARKKHTRSVSCSAFIYIYIYIYISMYIYTHTHIYIYILCVQIHVKMISVDFSIWRFIGVVEMHKTTANDAGL